MRRIESWLRSLEDKSRHPLWEFRYHLAMLLVARRYGQQVYHPNQLRELADSEFTDDDINSAANELWIAFVDLIRKKQRPLDQVAKGRDFVDALLARLDSPAPIVSSE